MPEQVWVEGLVVSTSEGDEYLEITYSWGGVELSDTVRFTVLPRDGVSGAELKLYTDAARTNVAASHPAAGLRW